MLDLFSSFGPNYISYTHSEYPVKPINNFEINLKLMGIRIVFFLWVCDFTLSFTKLGYIGYMLSRRVRVRVRLKEKISNIIFPSCNRTKSLRNQSWSVIKMRKMRGEWEWKPLKKRWIIPHFMTSDGWFLRHFAQLLHFYKK